MMLLRTLVLERSGHDAPVNGALLCGFAVGHIASNFLAYSLDEETEPGNSRVYIAALRRKSERYFLGSIDNQETLQTAMLVFKQILTLAAGSGAKPTGVTDPEIPYHFVDLKGCKLPPARTEDHHSLTIKKALVMKVITLGTSIPGLPAIESQSLIVPSIRFSSQTVSAHKTTEPEPLQPAVQVPQDEPLVLPAPAKAEPSSLFEVDSTLTNLARVAQELTQQKLAVLKQEEALEQLRLQLRQDQADFARTSQQELERIAQKDALLQQQSQALSRREEHLADADALRQQEQVRLDDWARDLDSQATRLRGDELAVRKKLQQLAAVSAQLPGLRGNVRELLDGLDEALALMARPEAQRDEVAQESR